MKTRIVFNLLSVILLACPAFANNGVELKNKLDVAEKNSSISHDALVQLRADQQALEKQESDIRAKYDGLLPAQKGVKLTKARKKVIAKLEKLEGIKSDKASK